MFFVQSAPLIDLASKDRVKNPVSSLIINYYKFAREHCAYSNEPTRAQLFGMFAIGFCANSS